MMSSTYDLLAARIEYAFASHRVQARVWDPITVTPGFIQFRFTVGAGVVAAKVLRLQDEIAYNLGAENVRIYRNGGQYFLELPRTDNKRGVKLVALLRKLRNLPHNTALLGLQPDGVPLLVSLGTPDVPHGLLSGTTGSGKTALLRTMLVSLVLANPAGRLQLVLIDPKDRGLAPFAPLPHIWRRYGIIADPIAASNVLEELVGEMDRRDRVHRALPTLLVVIDELADLLDAGGRSIGDQVRRLTQRGREAGIIVLAATQRPAAALVGGMIKANLPLRLIGRVLSADDARIASGVAGTGAERLHGRGDFQLIARGAPLRFQAAYIEPHDLDGLITIAAQHCLPGAAHRRRAWADLPTPLPAALPRPTPAALPAGLGSGYLGESAQVGSGSGSGPNATGSTAIPAAPPHTNISHSHSHSHPTARRRGRLPQGEGSRLRQRYSTAELYAAFCAAERNRVEACQTLFGYSDSVTLRLLAEAIARHDPDAAKELDV